MGHLTLLVLSLSLLANAEVVAADSPAPPWAVRSKVFQADEPEAPPSSLSAVQTTTSNEAGFMDPAQVKELLHRVWLATYRVNDLLTEVHPDRWNLTPAVEKSFAETLATLHTALSGLEQWRAQFEERTESMYLGFETYAALGAALPRLEGVARGIAQHENSSLAAQYTQAENQLFDVQQALAPYLGFLLRNQDQVLFATQTNLAACEKQLGVAMRGTGRAVKSIGNNEPPARPRSRRSRSARRTAARRKKN